MASDATPEQRSQWREDAQANPQARRGYRRRDARILALLDALDAAEARVAAAEQEALERAAQAIEAECGAANWALTFRNGLRHAVQIIVHDLMPRKDGE